MTIFLIVLGTIFIAEMGDKTQLLLVAMASKYKISQILAGTWLATILLNILAVFVGAALSQYLDMRIIKIIAGFAFFWFAWRRSYRQRTRGRKLFGTRPVRACPGDFRFLLSRRAGRQNTAFRHHTGRLLHAAQLFQRRRSICRMHSGTDPGGLYRSDRRSLSQKQNAYRHSQQNFLPDLRRLWRGEHLGRLPSHFRLRTGDHSIRGSRLSSLRPGLYLSLHGRKEEALLTIRKTIILSKENFGISLHRKTTFCDAEISS